MLFRSVTDDIKLFAEQAPSDEKWKALKTYYDAKFEQLWATFETMCHERQFVTPDVEPGPIL